MMLGNTNIKKKYWRHDFLSHGNFPLTIKSHFCQERNGGHSIRSRSIIQPFWALNIFCGTFNAYFAPFCTYISIKTSLLACSRPRLKCDGTRAEIRFRLSAKRRSPFKWAGASVQPTTGSRGVRLRGSNAGYIMFRGSVKRTGYPLHSPVTPSLPLPCVTVYCHISTGL